MRNIFLLLMLLIGGAVSFAQKSELPLNSRPLNSFNINLLGDVSILSVNYERQVLISPTFILSNKLGLGYHVESCFFCKIEDPNYYLTLPHHLTGNLGRGSNFFEFGLGGTMFIGDIPRHYLLYSIIGYRVLPLRSGKMNFRVFFHLPFLDPNHFDIFFMPFGLSFGVSI
ncbi:MAG: hypothetical protein HKN68_07225 [Saprospiraceae bacterium]|nr:hypothetical protein [Saprospiraceae bacterium]